MLDSKQKSLLIKIVIALFLLFGVGYMCTDDGEDECISEAIAFCKPIHKKINEASKILENSSRAPYVYRADLLKDLLLQRLHKCEELKKDIDALVALVKEKNQHPQPQYVIDECKTYLEQIKVLQVEIKKVQQEAKVVYDQFMEEWNCEARKTDSEHENLRRAEQICKELSLDLQEAKKRYNKVYPEWKECRLVYYRLIKRINLKLPQFLSLLAKRKERLKLADDSRNRVIKSLSADANLHEVKHNDGLSLVDHSTPTMIEIDGIKNAILQYPTDPVEVRLPVPKPEPKPLPPPEFKPDLVLTATGDLPETLLQPLVESWLTAGRATPVKGNRFIWDTRHGNKELEVNAPADMQGAQAGKLCIRIVPVDGVDAAFRSVGLHGHTHVMLTGANPSREALAEWLPEGQNPQDLGRSYKARICYDALVFFRGDSLDLKTPLRSAIMKKQPMVFSVGDAARSEAVQVFGLAPAAHDVTEQQNMDTRALCTKYADKIVLGVWHKDAVSALAFRDQPTICYAAGWESEEAFKNVPKEYLPETQGVSPNASTIATGRYAYSYSIYGYRTTRDKASRASVLAAQLLAYMADAENAQVAQTVRDGGFVPVDIAVDKMSRTQELTKDDLPLPVLLKAMGSTAESFGYDAEDAAWVYGVRIPFAMYFKTGSAKGGDEQVTLDADAEYYTSTEAFARIQELIKDGRAAIVVLGHADVQHGGGLKVDRASWKSNLALSQKRAKFTGDALKKKIPGNKSLHRVAVGTGWARPACDISLTKPIDEQENELARCRRAEVFIIFPVPGSGT